MKLTSSNALPHSVTVQWSDYGFNECEVVAQFSKGARDKTESDATALLINCY